MTTFIRCGFCRIPLIFVCLVALVSMTTPLVPAHAGEVNDEDATKSSAQDKDDAGDKGLPLEPERTLEFTTEEATWLSLDVDPDGRIIVFELLGDLYTLPIEGGEAHVLTSGMAFDSQPSYSPDGDWIAFLSDRDGSENLWICRNDGSDCRKLSDDPNGSEFASPTWTPDGQYVVVSRSTWGLRTYELWMYHVKGGAGVQITKAKATPETPSPARHNAIGARVSQDGRYIYYATKRGGFQYNASFPLWQIARRDLVSGQEDIITRELGSGIRPVISPDGRKLIYGTRHDAQTGLRIRDLQTGEDEWLKYPVQRDDQESRFTRDLLPGYAFMPDGKEIVLTYGGRIHRINIKSGDDRVIPFRARVVQQLGPKLHFAKRVEEGPVRARLIQDPAVSPDGSQLAFSALTHLYVMDLPDGKPRRVTSDDEAREFQPTWSPDGLSLAYVTWSTDGGDVWRVKSDGGTPKKVTRTSAFYSDPAWSPDGARIVALRAPAHERMNLQFDFGQPSGMDLVWIKANGGDANLIIPARGIGKPHFTGEKDRIYLYLSGGPFSDDGPNGLVSMRFDGTDRREHLKVTGPGLFNAEKPVPASDIRISPDGRWALTHVGNQLYVTAVPLAGDEPPVVNVGSPSLPLAQLTKVGADYFGWAEGGATITWAVGSTLFRQPFDTVSFAKPKKAEKNGEAADGADKAQGGEQKEPPDQVEEIEVALDFPRDVPKGTIVLRGATVITMRGDEILRNADIVVTDDRIAGIGSSGSLPLPEGAEVFDVSGKTIVPGFIDTHAHWFEIRRGVMDVENWSFLANLAYGVTAGLDVQTSTNDMFAYQDLVDTGEILGPRAYSTGPGIFSNNNFQSLDEVKSVLERYKKYYRTGNLKSYIVGNRKQRQWMVQASKELEMMPTTEGGLDLKLDLTHVLDGFAGNEHSLPIVPLYQDVVELVARSGIGYTPTLLVNYGGPFAENHYYTTEEVHDDAKLRRFMPHSVVDSKTRRVAWFREDEYAYPKTAAQAARIAREGGHIGVGGHGQLQGLGYHWELWALASGGMKPMEALRAATLGGAEIIGYEQDLGSLEKGKLADLVILDKDPRSDIRNTNSIRYVMKNGELFEGDTLDQIWPENRPLQALSWWDDEPTISGDEAMATGRESRSSDAGEVH